MLAPQVDWSNWAGGMLPLLRDCPSLGWGTGTDGEGTGTDGEWDASRQEIQNCFFVRLDVMKLWSPPVPKQWRLISEVMLLILFPQATWRVTKQIPNDDSHQICRRLLNSREQHHRVPMVEHECPGPLEQYFANKIAWADLIKAAILFLNRFLLRSLAFFVAPLVCCWKLMSSSWFVLHLASQIWWTLGRLNSCGAS